MASPSTPQAPPLGSVLVTGGCGFLGSHIVSLLLSRHASPATSVSVIDLRTSTNRHAGAQYHDCDLTDLPALRRLLDEIRPDVVIHTASPVLSNHSAAYRKLMWKINVQGTRDLVEECRTRGTKAFVYTSSASVVSDTKTDLVNADEEYGVVRGKLQREYYTDTKVCLFFLLLSFFFFFASPSVSTTPLAGRPRSRSRLNLFPSSPAVSPLTPHPPSPPPTNNPPRPKPNNSS